MREPIRENPPEGRGPRGPEPVRPIGPAPVGELNPTISFANLAEWGPTWGGMFVTLGVLLLLSSLGVAIGVGAGGTGAAIWGAISVIIAFFVGGWFVGRTLTIVDSAVSAAHGLLMWAVSLVFTLLFTVSTALLGLSALSAAAQATGVGNLVGSLGTTPAATTAVTSSWVTFIILLLSVIAAVIGALVGNQGRFTGFHRT